MATPKQDKDFQDLIKDEVLDISVPATALDQAISWIKDRLDPDEVFDKEELEDWATTNGWVKE